jgi:hypothetical protein
LFPPRKTRATSRSFQIHRNWKMPREALVAYAARDLASAADAAGDLVGSLKGPRDLSNSAEHMDGFGE